MSYSERDWPDENSMAIPNDIIMPSLKIPQDSFELELNREKLRKSTDHFQNCAMNMFRINKAELSLIQLNALLVLTSEINPRYEEIRLEIKKRKLEKL